MNVILYPDKKGLGPKTKYHPPKSPSWLTESRAWLAAPSGLGPQTLHSRQLWRSQASRTQLAFRLLRPPAPTEGDPGTAAAIRSQRQGWGRGSRPPQGLGRGYWATLVRALEPCRTQPSAYSLGPPAHPLAQGWMNWRAWVRPRTTSYLTLHLRTTAPLLSESPL